MKSRVLRHLGKEHAEIIPWQSQTYIIDTDQVKEKINVEKNKVRKKYSKRIILLTKIAWI